MDSRILIQCIEELASWIRTPPRVVETERVSRSCIELTLEWHGRDERQCLILDVDPEHPAAHLARHGRDTTRHGAGFAERIIGARISAIEIEADPRVWRIDLSDNEGVPQWWLIAAWTGRSGNLRLTDPSGRILEALLPGGPRPGSVYSPPPPDTRIPAKDALLPLSKALIEAPPDRLHHIVRRVVREVDLPSALNAVLNACERCPGLLPNIDREEAAERAACEILLSLRASEKDSSCTEHYLYTFPQREMLQPLRLDTSSLPAAWVSGVLLPSLERFRRTEPRRLRDSLDMAYRIQLKHANQERERSEALLTIRREAERLRRLHAALMRERVSPGEGARLRRSGEAILASIHAARKGDKELICTDWSDPAGKASLRITLDPAKTPAENAQDYFRRARRWDRGEPHRAKRLAAIDQASARLSELEARIAEASSPPSLVKLALEAERALGFLMSPRTRLLLRRSTDSQPHRARHPERNQTKRGPTQGSDRSGTARATEQESRFRPRSYRTKEGWTVLVGRSNEENDYLTHRLAHPEDFWLHAHGVPGSHVVLRREGRKDNPSARTLEEAAAIAAFFSKARHSSRAPVLYTLKKYVRKPRKAKPGLAVCTREKTLLVAPKDPDEGKVPEWMEE